MHQKTLEDLRSLWQDLVIFTCPYSGIISRSFYWQRKITKISSEPPGPLPTAAHADASRARRLPRAPASARADFRARRLPRAPA
ncbi:MAG TPA: hypothetical protein VMR14_02590, partial [Streptosporangiaceae bacterium]|nr:hypothetical protein [Streptosporangiaceae bacterium]